MKETQSLFSWFNNSKYFPECSVQDYPEQQIFKNLEAFYKLSSQLLAAVNRALVCDTFCWLRDMNK